MIKKLSLVAISLILGMPLVPSVLNAQSLDTVATYTKNADWKVRRSAFDTLESKLQNNGLGASDKQRVHSLLISLLSIEGTDTDGTEAHSEYFADLIESVAGLADQNAADALLDDNVLTTGNMAIEGVVTLGDPVVGKVVSAFAKASSLKRVCLARVATKMLLRHSVLASSNESILHTLLISAAEDENGYVRLNSIAGLAQFHDLQTLVILQKIANSDPFSVAHGSTAQYPVRQKAAEALLSSRN